MSHGAWLTAHLASSDRPLPGPPPALAPCRAQVMLTASHLPFNANGLKFFTAAGGLDKPDISQLLQLAALAAADAGCAVGER